jgi:glycosyltransferase involved in cell wall biosynthesis
MSLTIITPTIGSAYLQKCIDSVNNQTNKNFTYYIVVDGSQYNESVYEILKNNNYPKNFKIFPLIENIGSGGWCGHRTYIAMAFLTNSDYIMFLDEDNTIEPNHVDEMMKNIIEKKLDWTFALRNIIDKEGKFICQDKCESLGNLHHVWNNPNDFLVDTNCYCINREIFIKNCLNLYKKARPVNDIEADRGLYKALQKYKFESTSKYTVNYRVGNRSDSVKAEFFIHGNKMMERANNSVYVFHLDPNWTDKCIGTNELDYESRRYLYEDGNKTMLYELSKTYKLLNGYKNAIPNGATCLFTVMDLRLFPIEVLKRKDIKKIAYLLEGPNSWHGHNYSYEILNEVFDNIITYWEDMLDKPKVEYFPFISRIDTNNKYHLEIINKNRKYDKSIGLILANRPNNENYKINGIQLQRLDYLRKTFVAAFDNITVHGQNWDELNDHKYITIENIKNRMIDTMDINQFYKRFNFALIVENNNAKNYVSEKIYDAWIAGCIPIYYGNNNKINLPKNCHIDIKDYESIDKVKEYIDKLSKSDIDKYYENIHNNILNILEKVSPNELCKKIINLI